MSVNNAGRQHRFNEYAERRFKAIPLTDRRKITRLCKEGNVNQAVKLVQGKRNKQAIRRMHKNGLL